MLNLPAFGRRGTLLGLAGLGAGSAWAAPGAQFPDGALLLVAGPSGGRADRWADALSPALGRGLPAGTALQRQNVGGADGVTGANQFEALAAPDGSTALLVPGTAALSWLAGDTRARFDAAHWLPVWAGNVSAALASRNRLLPGRPVRMAVANVAGPDLVPLLLLDLMGIPVVPVPPAADPRAALFRADVDAVLLHGAALRTAMPELPAAGMALELTMGVLDGAGQWVRDPEWPDLPSAPEAIGRARPGVAPELLLALQAAAAAVRLDAAVVLPPLSPPGMVALWRRSCALLAQEPAVQAEAGLAGVRPASPAVMASSTAAIAAGTPSLLELRRWLAVRYNWRPA